MNYRTTFDTTNLPANTKKNIKELNAVALKKEEAAGSAKGTAGTSRDSAGSPTAKSTTTTGESDSDSDNDELLRPKTPKDQSHKEKKKAEW